MPIGATTDNRSMPIPRTSNHISQYPQTVTISHALHESISISINYSKENTNAATKEQTVCAKEAPSTGPAAAVLWSAQHLESSQSVRPPFDHLSSFHASPAFSSLPRGSYGSRNAYTSPPAAILLPSPPPHLPPTPPPPQCGCPRRN